MAQFLGRIKGSRGEATRLGTKSSGMVAEARGWNIGGAIIMERQDGTDIVRVYITSGSNGNKNLQHVGNWRRNAKTGEYECES